MQLNHKTERAKYTEYKYCQIWAWCLELCGSLCTAAQQATLIIGSSPWGAGVQIPATSWFTHTDCPLLLPWGWWRQQMEVSKCCDPKRSIDIVYFNNPTRGPDENSSTATKSTFCLITLRQIRQKKRQLWDCYQKSPSGSGVTKWYACWSCIYQHKHPMHDYFCLHL